jgi:serine/threonine-protein kinase
VTVGATVRLTVASGSNDVPAVAGLTVAAASAELESAGFLLSDASRQLDPAEVVTGSQPVAGTTLRLGVAVTVVVATPPSADGTPA